MRKFYTFGLICVLALTLILATGCSSNGSSGGNSNNQGNAVSTSTPTLVTQSMNLVNGVITVNAGSFYDKPFTIGSGYQNVNVTGSFQASGGSGNDIEVYIFSDMDFTNWSNGHQASNVYDSGKMTVGNISAAMTAGSYHLVFNNNFSTFTSKQVSTNANLNYSMWK